MTFGRFWKIFPFLCVYFSWFQPEVEHVCVVPKVSAEGQFQIDDIILVPELLNPGATNLATMVKMKNSVKSIQQ